MERARFGMFTFTTSTGELRRGDVPVRLQAQPARVLSALVSRPGEIVTRDTLQREIWSNGTHVDFERGLNFCIAQVRTALGDSADSPRYIETVPKQGYRFIAPVSRLAEQEGVSAQPGELPVEGEDLPAKGGTGTDSPLVPSPFKGKHSKRKLAILGTAAVLLIAATIGWARIRHEPPTVVVVPFYNETGKPELDALARSIGDAAVASLAAPSRIESLSVIGNAPALRHPFARQDVQQIAHDLGGQWVLIGQLKADGENLRVIAHLIRADDMKHVWALPFDDPAFALDAQARTADAIAAAVQTHLQ
jgi:DNA-binding winged helix-turn-helix (wHTH) protein/TolB-like protein